MDTKRYYEEMYKELETYPDKLWDKRWRLNNLYIVRSKTGEVLPFRMNETQEQIYTTMRPVITGAVVGDIYLKGRQIGCTTFWLLWGLDECLFGHSYKAGFISQSEEDAKEAFRKVRLSYSGIPEWLKTTMGWDLLEERGDGYVFGHGSTFRCAVSMVGDTLNFLHVSEYGVISRKYPWKAKEIRQGSFPAVSPGGRIVIESTNREMGGEFLDIWNASVEELSSCLQAVNSEIQPDRYMACDYRVLNKENPGIYKAVHMRLEGFMPHFFTWWQDKGYKIEVPADFIRTESEEERASRILSLYSTEISNEQLGWYRRQVKLQGETVKQEHPDTVEDALSSGGSQVFVLDKQIGIGHIKEFEGCLIYEIPKAEGVYSLGVDLSEGVGKDRSVIKVLRATRDKVWEVASYASSLAPLDEVAGKLELLYRMYTGKVVPEMNFNGTPFLNILLNSEVIDQSDIYRREIVDERTKRKTKKLGFKTTKSSKSKIISRLEREIRLGNMGVRSYEGLSELRTYTRDENGGTNALLGKRDDMVMAYALSLEGLPALELIREEISLPVSRNRGIMEDEQEPSYYLNNGICL